MSDLVQRMSNYSDSLAPPIAKNLIADAVTALEAANARISELESKASTVDDLRMIVQKLVHSLNKVSPSNDQGSKALDYLVRKGLAGSILRDADAVESRLAANVADSARDAERLNWLQEELVDTIYLDDGRVIDISGRRTVREAIDAAIAASAEKGETNV